MVTKKKIRPEKHFARRVGYKWKKLDYCPLDPQTVQFIILILHLKAMKNYWAWLKRF